MVMIPKDFKLTRVRVRSLEESQKIQKAMFKMGFKWITETKEGQKRVLKPFPVSGWIYVDSNFRLFQNAGPQEHKIDGVNTLRVSPQAIYEASEAFVKADKAKRKAKRQSKGGWIVHTGSVRPSSIGGKDKVDLKYRNNDVEVNRNPPDSMSCLWDTRDNMDEDIVAWRFSKEKAVEAMPVAMEQAQKFIDSVGDVNSDARGSGARYNANKPDFSLIPLSTLEGEARVWSFGAKKYKSWNWMKGMDWSVPYASAMRHMAAWQKGEEIDPESGESHLDHAMCNLRMLKYYADFYKEGDNRPKQFFVKE